MASPFIYFAGSRLSRAELSAACLDGDVIALGEAFVPADVVETAALRAASLAEMLGASLAASHLSAAWIFGGIDDPPTRHGAQRAVGRRLHHIIDRRLVYHDSFVPPEDLVQVGGVRVTKPARTLADLARAPTEAHVRALHSWVSRDASAVRLAREWFAERPRIPNRRRAELLLAATDEAVGQEDVTR